MVPPADRRYFFIHIMKTGGGTVWLNIKENFHRTAVYPDSDDNGNGPDEWGVSYYDIERMLALPEARRRNIRVYTGHFPFVVSELLGYDDLVTFTVLREPVERTISYLKHCHHFHPQHRGMPLEHIYEDGFINPFFIDNHQAKVFALTADDEPETIMDVLEVDDARLEIAKENLAKVDIVGVQDRLELFLDELGSVFGWETTDAPDLHVSADDRDLPDGLLERITADLEADRAFYEYAVRLVDERSKARS